MNEAAPGRCAFRQATFQSHKLHVISLPFEHFSVVFPVFPPQLLLFHSFPALQQCSSHM